MHGLSCANEDICKVTCNNLNFAGELPAMLVEEFKIKDFYGCLESKLKFSLRFWLASHALSKIEAQIQVSVGHDIDNVH